MEHEKSYTYMNFFPCQKIKSKLKKEKKTLLETIKNEQKEDIIYNKKMQSNTLESYKLLLIETILCSTMPVNTLEIMNNLILTYECAFDINSYKTAIRELKFLYSEFDCDISLCNNKNPCNNYN